MTLAVTSILNEARGPESLAVAPVKIDWRPSLPIYASEGFLQDNGNEYGWLGGSDEQGVLRCVLPFVAIRMHGFRFIRFQTQTIVLSGELDEAGERRFLSGVIEYFRSSGADMIVPSGNTAIFRTFPEGADAAAYGTFVKELDQAEEVLEREIRKTFRHNIRKALAAGVEIKEGLEHLDASYELIAETMRRSGAKFKNRAEFRRRISCFGENVQVFVAECNGAMQGCMVAPFSEYGAYNCYAGSRPQPALGSMHLLHWEAIRRFRAMGVKRFDFQGVRISPEKGSKQEGIRNYKQGFGGREIQGYLWKYSFRPLKCLAYSAAMRLLRGGDIVDQERGKRPMSTQEESSARAGERQ